MTIHKEMKFCKERRARGLAKADACGRGEGAGVKSQMRTSVYDVVLHWKKKQ